MLRVSIILTMLALSGPAAMAVPDAIHVVSATYGAACAQPEGNQTARVASECNDKSSCLYLVDNRYGDPSVGCAKDFSVQWQCGPGAATRTARHGRVVGEGYHIALSCGSGVRKIGPSFACTPDLSGVEKAICDDGDLAQLDVELTDIYRKTLAMAEDKHRRELFDAQRAWIASRDSSCPVDPHAPDSDTVVACVRPFYEQRIEALRNERKQLLPTWRGPELRPGQSAVTNDLLVQCLGDRVRVTPSNESTDRDSTDDPDDRKGLPPVYGSRGNLQSSYADCRLADGTAIRVKSGQVSEPMAYGQCGAAPGEQLSVWVDHRKVVSSFGYAGFCEDTMIDSLTVERTKATVCVPPLDEEHSHDSESMAALRKQKLDKNRCGDLAFAHPRDNDTREFPGNGKTPSDAGALTLDAPSPMRSICGRLLPAESGDDPSVPEDVPQPEWEETKVDLKQPDFEHLGYNATTLSAKGSVDAASFDLENAGTNSRVYMQDSSSHWFDGTALAIDSKDILLVPFDAHDDEASLLKGIHVWVYEHASVFFDRGKTYILLNPVNHANDSRVIALHGRQEETVCTFHRAQENF